MKFKSHNYLFAMSLMACSVLAGCGGGSDSGDDYSNLTCSNFGSQASAQDAYNKGAKQLDGDNDGRACENLK